MGWFRRKKKTEGIKETPKKPVAVKILDFFHSIGGTPVPPSVREYYGLSDSFQQNKYDLTNGFTVVKKYDIYLTTPSIIELVIVEKKLYLRKEYRCDFRRLSDVDIQNWIGRCGATHQGLTWRQVTTEGISCHSVSTENLYPIIHNVFDGNFTDCQSTGAFTNDELRKIFPEYDRQIREAELQAQEQAEQERVKRETIESEKQLDRKERLDYEIEKKIVLHGVDKKLKAQDEKERKKKSKPKLPKYSQTSRLGNIGFIVDEDFQSTGHWYKFDYDKEGPTHIVVVGASGWGKTVTAYDVAEGALENQIPVLVLDPQGQWSGFLLPCENEVLLDNYQEFGMTKPKGYEGKIYTPSSDAGLSLETNLLVKPTVTKGKDEDLVFSQHADEVIVAIKDFCNTLNNKQMTAVRNRIIAFWKNGKNPNYKTLVKDDGPDGLDEKIDPLSTDIQGQLASLASVSFLFEGEQRLDISNLLEAGKISTINLRFVNEEIRYFTAYYILKELLNWFDSSLWKGSEEKLELLLVIEEALRFNDEAEKTLIDISETIRKHGVGVMFISQRLVRLNPNIRTNVSTKMYLKMEEKIDREDTKDLIGDEMSKALATLKKGRGVVKSPNHDEPFLVKFKPCYARHNPMLEPDEIKQLMQKYKSKTI